MRFLPLMLALVLACFTQSAHAANAIEGGETMQTFEYLFTEDNERAQWAALTEEGLAVAGANSIYFFNEKRFVEICKDCNKPYGSVGASRLPVSGYPLSVTRRPDGKFVIAGVGHDAKPDLSNDSRKGYVALVDKLRGYNKDIQTFEYGRVARKVIAAGGNQSLVLFEGGADGNMIALMDSQNFVLKKVVFGEVSHADIARHANGYICVLGFENAENGWQQPVYWRFSADLKEIQKRPLNLPRKRSSSTDGMVKIAVAGDIVYLLYGIPEGVKDTRPDGMVFQSLGGFRQTMPYAYNAALVVTPNGFPMVATVVEGRPKTVTHNAATNKISTGYFAAPEEPAICFMQKERIRFVDVLFDKDGFGYFVMGSKPLAHNEAGCIAVARAKF